MEFGLLGPLEVRKDGRALAVGGPKQRALLAILLLHAGEVVSRDRLIDELWGERPPGTAGHSLDHQVSRLRKTLDLSELLVTRPGGYMLEVDPEEIDVHRFERLLDEGRRSNAAGRPAEAAETLREALDLWRGGALADLAYATFARTEIERLEELRLAAIEERTDADLALGRHQALVAELDQLTAKHPLRERLRAQLMLALYRSGRQAEALRVYADERRRLVEELGLEPGQALQQLEQAILRQDPSLDLAPAAEVAPGKRPRRRAIVAAASLLLAAGAAAAGVVLAHGGTQSSHAQPLAQVDSVVLLSARTGKVVAPTVGVRAPLLSRFGEGALWTVSSDGELTRIDPATGKVVAFLNTGIAVPCGLAVGEGAVWVTDCKSTTLVRIDPTQNAVTDRIRLPTAAGGLAESVLHEVALGAGSVWVEQGDFNPSWVDRVDPKTGRVEQRIRIPEVGANALAFGDGALWVVSSFKGYLTKIDPRTNEITATVHSLHGQMCCVAVGGGAVWAATAPDQKVWKLSEDGTVLASIKLPANVESLTYADGALWVADGDAGAVIRIDPTTNATRTYPLGARLFGAAAQDGVVAVGVQPSDEDVTAGLAGKVVRLALRTNYLDWTSTDPAATQTAFNPYQVQFQYATCAKLFNYPDASGATGKRLAPEVAAAWPTVTDGGRTYTFRIRRGYRFSPPSNEPVTAESFRHAIERFLSPRLQPGPWNLAVFSDVVGANAYHDGSAAHVSGISARDNTLVIRLVRPGRGLPLRLALPGACAVPANLQTVYHGLSGPIPSAGPYYLAARSENVLVLKRNPSYHGPRPHSLDAIVYRMNVDVGTAAAQAGQGKVDYLLEDDPALAPDTAAAHAAGPRYRRTPNNWTELLALNTRRPLFADSRLRRAVEYAIDRRALAAGFGLPTSHVLPPNFPSSGEASPYPLSPKLDTARKLVAGRHLHAVFATVDPTADPGSAAFTEAVRSQLAAVGITVTVLPLTDLDSPASAAAKVARADLVSVTRDASQTVDPAQYLAGLPYFPAFERDRLNRIDGLSPPRREAAAAAFAARLEQEAVYVPYADNAIPELVSNRVGCVVHQPEYPGVDLAALCLRNG